LIALLACQATAPGGSASASPEDDDDTGPAPVVGEAVEVEVEVADVPTVLRARWETPEETDGVVTYTFEGETHAAVDDVSGTSHEVLLTGIPANTDVEISLRSEGASGGLWSGTASATTGSLPTWVPALDYSADDPDASEGGVTLIPAIFLPYGGVVAVDGLGRPVWAWPVTDEGHPKSIFRAHQSRDGSAILFNDQAESKDTPGTLWRVSLDGSTVTSVEVNGAHTDFVETADEAYAVLGWDIQTFEGRNLLGDTIVEVAADGTQTTLWNTFDWYEPDLSKTYDSWYPTDDTVEDWSHVNGISYDAASDDFFVSMTFDHGVARVDGATGELEWTLSDEGGDFENVGDAGMLSYPHSAQFLGDGVLAFNRGDPYSLDSCSEAAEIAIDEASGTASRAWSYDSDACLLVTFLGEARRLEGGNTLVVFTTSGQVDEVTPDGTVTWRVATDLGTALGFSERVKALGVEAIAGG
jgi:hypothetical protein